MNVQKLIFLLLSVPLLSYLNPCFSQDTAYVAGAPEAYVEYGLRPGNVPEEWEDGIRTGGVKGTYEWWYFDAHLDDGTTMVIIFYTKPFTAINKGLTPFITLNIDRPDGSKITRRHYGEVDEFSASETGCDVKIGKNYFRGNLEHYEIHFEDEDLQIDASVERTTQSWRPRTGHFRYGDKGEYFAWMVPVPKGEAKIVYSYQGKSKTLSGSCYHDHNWGNRSMADFINHWYWARAEIGPYTIIAAELISAKEYGSGPVIVFNLSKDGKTVADEGDNVKLLRSYGLIHEDTYWGKPVSDDLKFVYESPDDDLKYEFSLHREKNLLGVGLLDAFVKGKFKRKLARMLTGFAGAYYRMTGEADIKVYRKGNLEATHSSPTAVWELMYFGKPYE